MSLLKIQEELAAILMEPQARKAFASDPRKALAARGLSGRDLDILASLDANDMAYFAERRNIDRLQALRADAPRSVPFLESLPGRAKPYFRAFPFSLEDPQAETDRFAQWCKGAAIDGGAPTLLADLAAFDATALRLTGQPPLKDRASTRPCASKNVVLLQLSNVLPPVLRSGDPSDAVSGRSVLALQRTHDDVLWHELDQLDFELVRLANGRRAEAQWITVASSVAKETKAETMHAAQHLLQKGLVVQAKPAKAKKSE